MRDRLATTGREFAPAPWAAVILALACLGGAARPSLAGPGAGEVRMIFWEKQDWEAGGGSARLTLWEDGRSEITVRERGKPGKPRPGWSARSEKSWAIYTKSSPYRAEEARRKFRAAVAAGIGELRTFPPGYADGSGTLAGVVVDGRLTETVIPMFLHEGRENNKGSENHKRFLAVDAILGRFEADATESEQKP